MRIYRTILLSTLLVAGMTHHVTFTNVNSFSKSEAVAFLATQTNPEFETQGVPHRGSGR